MAVLVASMESLAQIPYAHVREADVMWSTRIWRELDLREKLNLPMYYPIRPSQGYKSLFDVLVGGIQSELITAYAIDPLGIQDDFSSPLSITQVQAILCNKDSVYTLDLATGELILVIQKDSLASEDVTRYRLKEDWYFDREEARMNVRIIGIAPLKELRADDGVVRGYSPLFWIYFREARALLAGAPVYLRHNDTKDLSYDDLFAKRFFHGYIVKSTNVFDRSISDYCSGIDALVEVESIEEELRQFESDFWSH